MLILLLCTHIWDPHKLSTKQIIGHIAPKKIIMCGLPLSEKPDIRVPVYYITHCYKRNLRGPFRKSAKKGKKE